MWFLVLEDVDRNRYLYEWDYKSKAETIAAIESAVLLNPSTLRVHVGEARESFRIGIDVRVTPTAPEEE